MGGDGDSLRPRGTRCLLLFPLLQVSPLGGGLQCCSAREIKATRVTKGADLLGDQNKTSPVRRVLGTLSVPDPYSLTWLLPVLCAHLPASRCFASEGCTCKRSLEARLWAAGGAVQLCSPQGPAS